MEIIQKALTDIRMLLLSAGLGLTATLTGQYVVPRYFDGIRGRLWLWIVLSVLALVALLWLLWAFFERAKEILEIRRSDRSVGEGMLGFARLLGLCLVGLAVIALVCGLLAVAIQGIFKNSMTTDQIKNIVTGVSTGLTVAVLPLVLNLIFAYGLSDDEVLESALNGIKISGKRYLLLLALCLVLYGLGWGAFGLFGLTPHWAAGVLQSLILTALCVLGMIAATAICDAASSDK